MAEDKTGDDQVQKFLWEAEEGLSVTREDASAAPSRERPRRGSGVFDRLLRSTGVDETAVVRWFVPVSAMILVILAVILVAHFSRGAKLDTLANEVASLKQQAAATNVETLRAEIDQLSARVEGLTTRFNAVDDIGPRLQALSDEVVEQGAAISVLEEKLETSETSSGQQASPAQQASATGPESGQAVSGPAGDGSWVVNVITVSDVSSAERVQKRVRDTGVDSRIEAIERDGKTLQRLLVPGFQSQDKAEAFASAIKQRLGLADKPWITRQ